MKAFKHSYFYVIFALILLMVGAWFLAFSPTSVYAETAQQKKYEYVVLQKNGVISVKGEYENGAEYVVSSATHFEKIMSVIDSDRLELTNYHDAVVKFQNVSVGNAYLEILNGNITIGGVLSGVSYSTFGLIYVNGASVTFENATLSNAGISPLVRNDGAGVLKFVSGNYSSSATTILSQGAGNLEILGGTIQSQEGEAVRFVPSAPTATLLISDKEADPKILTLSQSASALTAVSGKVILADGLISSGKSSPVVKITNSEFSICGGVSLQGGEVKIETNIAFSALNGATPYIGSLVSVNYIGNIVSGQTVVVKNVSAENENLFVVANDGYRLVKNLDNLIAYKTYTIEYNDPKNFITRLPRENSDFLAGEKVDVKIPSSADMLPNTTKKYEFLGWSENPSAVTATYTQENSLLTFGSENVTLYAVWKTLSFEIVYSGLDGVVNSNPLIYYSDQELEIENPEKQYYVFTGWVVNGQGMPQRDFVIEEGSWGELTLEAKWEYRVYAINYHGVPDEIVTKNGLVTTYTIVSSPLSIKLEDVFGLGYSYYGMYYDLNRLIECDDTIVFDPLKQNQNSTEFLMTNQIGRDINIYVDMAMYFNGEGEGGEENPFKIDSFAQLKNLVSGQKIESEPVYISLASDIMCDDFGASFVALENVVFDGAGYKLLVQKFTNKNGEIAVFPVVRDAVVKNLTVQSALSAVVVIDQSDFGGFCGTLENSEIDGLVLDISKIFVAGTAQGNLALKFGALAVNALNSKINDVLTLGDFTVNFDICGGDVNIYGANLIGFGAQSCEIINCENRGDISVALGVVSGQAHTFLAGFACLDGNNKIINCLNKGDISLAQEKDNIARLCGIAMPFNTQNTASCVVMLGEVISSAVSDKVVLEEFWPKTGMSAKSFLSGEDFERNQENALSTLVSGINSAQPQTDFKLKNWFVDPDGEVQFTTGLYVYYKGNGIMKNATYYFANPEEASKKHFWFDPSVYNFYGWVDASGKMVDWEEVNSPAITVYASYSLVDAWISAEQIKIVVLDVAILLVVILIMVLLDMPKPVRFVKNGQVVAVKKLARGKIIDLPQDFNDRICFVDEDGSRPLVNKKMPWHPVRVYIFDDEKQKRLEQHWKKVFDAREENKRLVAERAEGKKRLASQRKLEVLKIRQERALKRKQDALKRKQELLKAKEEEKQKRLEQQKLEEENKQVVSENDSRITIIKKEIKVIKNGEVEETVVEEEEKPLEKEPSLNLIKFNRSKPKNKK